MSLFEVTQFSKQSLQLIYIRSKKQRRSTGATEKRPRDPEAVKSKDLGRTRGLRATQPLVHVTFFVGRGCWLFLNYFCRTNVPPMTQIRAIHLAIAQPSIFAITLPRNRSSGSPNRFHVSPEIRATWRKFTETVAMPKFRLQCSRIWIAANVYPYPHCFQMLAVNHKFRPLFPVHLALRNRERDLSESFGARVSSS